MAVARLIGECHTSAGQQGPVLEQGILGHAGPGIEANGMGAQHLHGVDGTLPHEDKPQR